MSVDDRRKSPASDPGADHDRPSTTPPFIDEEDATERDALLALLLDETEPPEEVALLRPSGIEHRGPVDLPFEAPELEVQVESGEVDESEIAETLDAAVYQLPEVVPFEPPPAPQLLVPDVRQFSADDETQVYDVTPVVPTPEELRASEPAVEPDIDVAAEPQSEVGGLADLLEPGDEDVPPMEEPETAPTSDEVSVTVTDDEVPVAIAAEEEVAPQEPEATPLPLAFPNERPAREHLEESGRRDAFLARAAFIEAEARQATDPAVTARGLLIAAELYALAGEDERARELGEAAKQASPSHPLSHRFTRAFALKEGDHAAFVAALDAEARVAKTPAARTHAALLAAEFARFQLGDAEGHATRLEQALRTSPSDVRAMLSMLADALAHDRPLPRLRYGEALSAAVRKLARYRGDADQEASVDTVIDAVLGAREAYARRDRERLVAALEALTQFEGLKEAAAWLGAALAAPSPATRRKALDFLAICREGAFAALAQRWTLARALELGDEGLARETLANAAPFTWSRTERLGLAALTGASFDLLAPDLDEALGEAEPFAAGLVAAMPDGQGKSTRALAPARQIARMLAARAVTRELRHLLDTAFPASFQSEALRAELDLTEGRLEALADTFVTTLAQAHPHVERDRALVAGLFQELSGRREAAAAEYERARQSDPGFEAAVRAARDTKEALDDLEDLLELARRLDEPARAAFVFLEAAARTRNPQLRASYLEEAYRRDPSVPFTAWAGEDAARANGDPEERLRWLTRARETASDPIEKAWLLVAEARLRKADDPELAARLLEEASQAHPQDRALRALYERFASEPPGDRASWLLDRANEAEGEDRALLALAAALEFEAQGQEEAAAQAAKTAVDAGETLLAPLCQERTAGESARDEAVDELSRLRALEHRLIGEGRLEELEGVFSAITKVLADPETTSHAMVAARLRQKKAPTASIRDLVVAASRIEQPSLWALRQLEVHAREAGDDASARLAADELARRTNRPLERATLLLRAAEACVRLGDDGAARERLILALELEPNHRVALELLAEVAERLGDDERAAQCYEKLAETSQVTAYRLDAWTKAAVLWLDRVGDTARGRAALEAAADIDSNHADVFDRLRGIYVAQGEESALATLLERRLATVTEPKERVRLEIERARLGARRGDVDLAKASLLAALEASPDHPEALRALAELCTGAEDWEQAAWALERLARLSTQPEDRAELHVQLGDLRRTHLSDWEGAEAAYREALSHRPDDVAIRERLIDVYARSGRASEALELQQALVAAAAGLDEAKRRALELARLQEQLEASPSVAEATFDTLRKQHPTDPEVLEAYVGFLRRRGRDEAAASLLDKMAQDARRALSTGRFDPSLFGVLATIARLRDDQEAARVADATLAAIEGRGTELAGIGLAATRPEIDDLVAPDPLTPAFRELLARTGAALDAAVPYDLHAIRAMPLPEEHAALGQEIRELAEGFGLNVDVLCSPALGHVCVPARCTPPQLVLGIPLVTSSAAAVRRFLVLRALKILALRAAALSRTAPIDLFPLVTAYLRTFVPDYAPPGVDLSKVAPYAQKIAAALPKNLDAETTRLAQKVVDALGNRASTLNTVVNAFGNRVALLAIGDPTAALTGIGWAFGNPNGPPPSGRDRITWVGRNAEARDVVVFSISDAYARLREE